MKRFHGLRGTLILAALALMIFGYYMYLSHKNSEIKTDDGTVVTAVQSLLARSIDNNYPPTPKEVLKYYSDITKCFYGETYTEEELLELAKRSRSLLDEELVAKQTESEYLDALKLDIDKMKASGTVISSYVTSASTDVFYFKEDGYEWARLNCNYTLRCGVKYIFSTEVFVLRRDTDGHWKIFGWDLLDENGE